MQKDKDGKGPEVHVWNIDEKKERWKFAAPNWNYGQVTFSPSARTSCRNLNGLTFAIA